MQTQKLIQYIKKLHFGVLSPLSYKFSHNTIILNKSINTPDALNNFISSQIKVFFLL